MIDLKNRRQFAIIDIISNYRVRTQEELCELLREQGFDVTQATVSRDIKELKLVKVPDDDGYHYAMPDTQIPRSSLERLRRLFRDSVISVVYSENLVVIKTLPGTANAVAAAIDSSDVSDILGTLAGDDTILVVARGREYAEPICRRFRELIE